MEVAWFSIVILLFNRIKILQDLLSDLNRRIYSDVLLLEYLLKVGPFRLYTVFKLFSSPQDVYMDVEDATVDHHLVEVVSDLSGLRVLPCSEILDDSGQIDWLLDLLVVIRQEGGVNWFSEDLGELLLDESVDHAEEFLLDAVLWLDLAH